MIQRDIAIVARDPSARACREFIEDVAKTMGVTARTEDYEVDFEIGKWLIGEWKDTCIPALMTTVTKGFDLNRIVDELENAATQAMMEETVMDWEIIISLITISPGGAARRLRRNRNWRNQNVQNHIQRNRHQQRQAPLRNRNGRI